MGRRATRAWNEAIEAGVIVGSQFYKNGQQVEELTGRGLDSLWAVGLYHFEEI